MIAIALLAVLAADVPGPAVGSEPLLLNGGDVITPDDYPEDELNAGHEGRVSALLRVSAKGRVIACSVTESSGFPKLDSTSCALMMARSRFKPAHDSQGMPQDADYHTASTWSRGPGRMPLSTTIALPVNHLAATYRGPVKTRLLIDETGHVASCDITQASGSDAADMAVCAYLKQSFVMPPPQSGSSTVSAMAVRYVAASLSEQQAAPSKPQ